MARSVCFGGPGLGEPARHRAGTARVRDGTSHRGDFRGPQCGGGRQLAQGCHSCLALAVSPGWHRRACVPGLAAGNSQQDVKQMMQAFRNRKAVIFLLQTRRGASAGAGVGAAARGV